MSSAVYSTETAHELNSHLSKVCSQAAWRRKDETRYRTKTIDQTKYHADQTLVLLINVNNNMQKYQDDNLKALVCKCLMNSNACINAASNKARFIGAVRAAVFNVI